MEKTYALWVMPSGETYLNLKNEILRLSKEHNTVDFEPHVTIIGGLIGEEAVLIKKMEEFRSTLSFEVSLRGLQHSDEYFKCIFLECERSRGLANLNQKAKILFGRLNDPEFKPHLSLLYAKLEPEVREGIVDNLKMKYGSDLHFEVTDIRFMLTAQHPALELKKFEFIKKNKVSK